MAGEYGAHNNWGLNITPGGGAPSLADMYKEFQGLGGDPQKQLDYFNAVTQHGLKSGQNLGGAFHSVLKNEMGNLPFLSYQGGPSTVQNAAGLPAWLGGGGGAGGAAGLFAKAEPELVAAGMGGPTPPPPTGGPGGRFQHTGQPRIIADPPPVDGGAGPGGGALPPGTGTGAPGTPGGPPGTPPPTPGGGVFMPQRGGMGMPTGGSRGPGGMPTFGTNPNPRQPWSGGGYINPFQATIQQILSRFMRPGGPGVPGGVYPGAGGGGGGGGPPPGGGGGAPGWPSGNPNTYTGFPMRAFDPSWLIRQMRQFNQGRSGAGQIQQAGNMPQGWLGNNLTNWQDIYRRG